MKWFTSKSNETSSIISLLKEDKIALEIKLLEYKKQLELVNEKIDYYSKIEVTKTVDEKVKQIEEQMVGQTKIASDGLLTAR